MTRKRRAVLFLGIYLSTILSACSLIADRPELVIKTGSPASSAVPIATLAQTTAVSIPITPLITPPELETLYTPGTDLDSLVIIYAYDGQLWIWSKGKKVHITTQGTVFSPRVSADGSIIAFLRPIDDYRIELWAINLDGTHERRLVSTSDMEAIAGTNRNLNAVSIVPHRFEWLPGTHSLAFNTEYTFQGPGAELLEDFILVEADSGKLNYSLLAGWGGEFYLSPSGNQVALTTPTKLMLSDLQGSNWRVVFSYDPVITYSDYRYYAAPVWSPDGSHLILALPPTDPLSEPAAPTRLYRIDGADSSIRELGQIDTVPFFDSPGAFSPDFRSLAFISSSGSVEENIRSLYISTADGSGSKLYQEGKMLQFHGWSLDGNLFVFSQGEDQELYLGTLNKATRKLSSALMGVMDTRWIDQSRFIYIQGRGEKYSLYIADIGGSNTLVDSILNERIEYDFFWR